MDRLAKKFFNEKEILSIEDFHKFIDKKKVIVFIPISFVEKLTIEMSKAGAGLIGNYEMCSFRTEGIGTFKPNEKADPFSGKKNQLSYAEEIKLEMECDSKNLNRVIDALLKNHPYDEVAYEVYDFKKRDKKNIGVVVALKSKMRFSELIKRINKKLDLDNDDFKYEFKKIAITSLKIDSRIIESIKLISCECLLSTWKNNYKLLKYKND